MKSLKWFLLFVGILLLASSCASQGGPRHIATVSVVTAHTILATLQDTEMALVCGKPTAPEAPRCVEAEKHKEISGYLAQAFDYDGTVARLVRALPPGSPQPAQVGELLARISELVSKILASIPASPQKATLEANLGK